MADGSVIDASGLTGDLTLGMNRSSTDEDTYEVRFGEGDDTVTLDSGGNDGDFDFVFQSDDLSNMGSNTIEPDTADEDEFGNAETGNDILDFSAAADGSGTDLRQLDADETAKSVSAKVHEWDGTSSVSSGDVDGDTNILQIGQTADSFADAIDSGDTFEVSKADANYLTYFETNDGDVKVGYAESNSSKEITEDSKFKEVVELVGVDTGDISASNFDMGN